MKPPLSPSSGNELEPELAKLAQQLPQSILIDQIRGNVHGILFHCDPIMEFARLLRDRTKGAVLASQHHAFKILFKYFCFGPEGQFEVTKGPSRIDIYLPTNNQVIEVKTIAQMSVMKVYQKLQGIFHTFSHEIDHLWLFFFYKLTASPTNHPQCKYLLRMVS